MEQGSTDPVVIRERIAEEIERAIERAEGRHTYWGWDDCTIWIADILRAATGEDPARDFRDQYTDKASAYAVIGPRGLAYGIQRRARRYGWRPMRKAEIPLAQVGDIGIYRAPGLQALVIKVAGRFWVGRADMGVAMIPSDRVTAAWSVA